jgi:hypothetical protein
LRRKVSLGVKEEVVVLGDEGGGKLVDRLKRHGEVNVGKGEGGIPAERGLYRKGILGHDWRRSASLLGPRRRSLGDLLDGPRCL